MKGLYVLLGVGLALGAGGCERLPCTRGAVFVEMTYGQGLGADRVIVVLRTVEERPDPQPLDFSGTGSDPLDRGVSLPPENAESAGAAALTAAVGDGGPEDQGVGDGGAADADLGRGVFNSVDAYSPPLDVSQVGIRQFAPSPRKDGIEFLLTGAASRGGYREGVHLIVHVDAYRGDTLVGGGEVPLTLAPGCTLVEMTVAPNGLTDVGTNPGGTVDRDAGNFADGGFGYLPDLTAPPPLILFYVPQRYLTAGTCDVTLGAAPTATHTFNTDTGLLDGAPLPSGCVFAAEEETPRQPYAESFEVAVLAVRNWTIAEGAVLQVQGSKPLVLLAAQDLLIDGTLDGSAHGRVAGPGGMTGGFGVGGSGLYIDGGYEPIPPYDSLPGGHCGGGGGAHVSSGAPGTGCYFGATQLPGGREGIFYYTVDRRNPLPIQGGTAGGRGGISPPYDRVVDVCGAGGGGGGGIQLAANRIFRVGAQGKVLANGGGGLTGCTGYPNSSNAGGGGGGGGAGGGIYVEASTLIVESGGVLAANGGGGGGGSNPSLAGTDGQDGLASTAPAEGGRAGAVTTNGSDYIPVVLYAGPGGKGASREAVAATTAPDVLNNTGGGGGGLGVIILRAWMLQLSSDSVISPKPLKVVYTY
ncbi:MAG TPA: hypothetical protein VH877_21580 [Polyangia bacterium]|jgi:hypothetical protein|nr:hypothetical protein [Polyangia bacterium]